MNCADTAEGRETADPQLDPLQEEDMPAGLEEGRRCDDPQRLSQPPDDCHSYVDGRWGDKTLMEASCLPQGEAPVK